MRRASSSRAPPTTFSCGPCHPYTIGLMRSVPRLDMPRGQRLETIEGLPPDLRSPPAGCRFAPRCPFRIEICAEDPAAARARRRPPIRLLARRRDRRGHAGAGSRGARSSALHAAANGAATPLLKVEHLHKYFEIKAAGAGFLSSKTAIVKAVEDVSFSIAAGETLGPRRRVRLRQDHRRPHHAQARRGRPAAAIDFAGTDITHRSAGRDARGAAQDPGRSSRTPIRRSIRA